MDIVGWIVVIGYKVQFVIDLQDVVGIGDDVMFVVVFDVFYIVVVIDEGQVVID